MKFELQRKERLPAEEKEQEQFSYKIIESRRLKEELHDRTKKLVDRVVKEDIDTLVFLDKSARPISWLFRELWKVEQPDKKSPDIKFVNFGIGHPAHDKVYREERVDLDREIEAVKPELQKWFKDQFAQKQVLIVDEVSKSGRSLLLAKEVIERVFPEVSQVEETSLFDAYLSSFTNMPWRSKKEFAGATGVMAFDEDLFSRRVSSEGLKESLDRDIEKYLEQIDGQYSGVEKLFALLDQEVILRQFDVKKLKNIFEQALSKELDLNEHEVRLRVEIQKWLDESEKAYAEYKDNVDTKEEKLLMAIEYVKLYRRATELWQWIRLDRRGLEDITFEMLLSDNAGRFQEIKSFLAQCGGYEDYQSMLGPYLFDLPAMYRLSNRKKELERLQNNAKQLRAEMKHIAQKDYDAKKTPSE